MSAHNDTWHDDKIVCVTRESAPSTSETCYNYSSESHVDVAQGFHEFQHCDGWV